MVQADQRGDDQRGQVVAEIEVGDVVEPRVWLDQLLNDRVEQRDAESEQRQHAGEERGPQVQAPAQRLAVGGRRCGPPVGEPDGAADHEERDPQAQPVAPVERGDADHRGLDLLGQRPKHATRADGHRAERHEGREVDVQASDRSLA